MDNNQSFLNSDDSATSKVNGGDDSQEWQTVNFPRAIRVEDIETTPTPEATPSNGISQIAELISLIQQVRQRNNELTQRVAILENSLHETQIALDLTQGRNQSQEALLSEQTRKIETANSHNQRLTQELEATSQNAQRQQQVIQHLTEQLETALHRLAAIERECSITQQRFAEQTHQLLQAENSNQDLRTRLHRQQRHTLQFKVALEKCIETPPVSKSIPSEVLESPVVLEAGNTSNEVVALSPKPESIKPWSSSEPATTEPATTEPTITEPATTELASTETGIETTTPITPANTLATTEPTQRTDKMLWQHIIELIDRNSPPAVSEPAKQPTTPVPLVYPQKQATKKLHSLAAIDLPTFPKLGDA